MRISEVEAIHCRVPEVDEIADGTLDVLLVRIHTDDGLTGLGEVTSQSYVCKAVFEAGRSAARRHGLATILKGDDPRDVGRLWEKMYRETSRYGRRGAAVHAISGADIALWDLKGKIEKKPLYELFGGAERRTVRAYASLLFGRTPEETAEVARQAVGMDLTAAKFGWGGFGEDPHQDLEHVRAARETLGEHRDLMIDAGQAWDWPTALKRAELFEPYDILWLEEPLKQDDRRGYAELCRRSPVPIAAGEGDVTRWDFEDLVGRGVHVLQPDVAFCGGLTVARQVSAMAEQAGRRCVPHCFSTGINLAASLHWMAAERHGDLVEYCLRPSPLMRKLVADLPEPIDGRVPVPQAPGLGIELDEGILEEYRVG